MRYRKKPIVIEAFEYCEDFMKIGANCRGVPEWGISAYDDGIIYFDNNGECFIKTLEGDMKVGLGDYIIRGVNGEIYNCKAEIFEKTYEVAE